MNRYAEGLTGSRQIFTFFPMRFSGMTGMPRRTWRYDANQGWDMDNKIATVGSVILGLASLLFVYNLIVSRRRGAIAGRDPWGAPTIEWTIPSPPPEYNYAQIPTVRSRYPLWDLKSPQLTADVPHSKAGDRRVDVDIAGRHTGRVIDTPSDTRLNAEEAAPTAHELGIHMPLPTIKPLVASIALTLAFVGLMLDKNLPIMIGSGALFVASLYAWLLSPLEPPATSH